MSQAFKKQKVEYIDRAKVLSGSRKMPNVLEGTIAVPCVRQRKYSFACKFKHRLTIPENEAALDAIVLENDICVLVCKRPVQNVSHTAFSSTLSTECVSGRMKKGAVNLKAGLPVCALTLDDGTVINLVSPVGGKLLELNEKLSTECRHLLAEKFDSEGFIAIVYPDTEIPTLDGYSDWLSLAKSFEGKVNEKGACFEFSQTGSCKRGDKCKFKHKSVHTVL
jgi:hypothetical protein